MKGSPPFPLEPQDCDAGVHLLSGLQLANPSAYRARMKKIAFAQCVAVSEDMQTF